MIQLRRVVWYDYIPEDQETEEMLEKIYYASLHDTDESYIKTLVIVKTKRTEFYQMKILEDGEVEMTLSKVCTCGHVTGDYLNKNFVTIELRFLT